MERLKVEITTNGDGDGTGYIEPTQPGFVRAIRYIKDGTDPYSDGVSLTVTGETTGIEVLTQAAMNASVTKFPRQPTQGSADGSAALYAAGGTAVNDLIPIVREKIKLVIASGGDTKTGTFHVWIG
jgi:hypothetical protein